MRPTIHLRYFNLNTVKYVMILRKYKYMWFVVMWVSGVFAPITTKQIRDIIEKIKQDDKQVKELTEKINQTEQKIKEKTEKWKALQKEINDLDCDSRQKRYLEMAPKFEEQYKKHKKIIEKQNRGETITEAEFKEMNNFLSQDEKGSVQTAVEGITERQKLLTDVRYCLNIAISRGNEVSQNERIVQNRDYAYRKEENKSARDKCLARLREILDKLHPMIEELKTKPPITKSVEEIDKEIKEKTAERDELNSGKSDPKTKQKSEDGIQDLKEKIENMNKEIVDSNVNARFNILQTAQFLDLKDEKYSNPRKPTRDYGNNPNHITILDLPLYKTGVTDVNVNEQPYSQLGELLRKATKGEYGEAVYIKDPKWKCVIDVEVKSKDEIHFVLNKFRNVAIGEELKKKINAASPTDEDKKDIIKDIKFIAPINFYNQKATKGLAEVAGTAAGGVAAAPQAVYTSVKAVGAGVVGGVIGFFTGFADNNGKTVGGIGKGLSKAAEIESNRIDPSIGTFIGSSLGDAAVGSVGLGMKYMNKLSVAESATGAAETYSNVKKYISPTEVNGEKMKESGTLNIYRSNSYVSNYSSINLSSHIGALFDLLKNAANPEQNPNAKKTHSIEQDDYRYTFCPNGDGFHVTYAYFDPKTKEELQQEAKSSETPPPAPTPTAPVNKQAPTPAKK